MTLSSGLWRDVPGQNDQPWSSRISNRRGTIVPYGCVELAPDPAGRDRTVTQRTNEVNINVARRASVQVPAAVSIRRVPSRRHRQSRRTRTAPRASAVGAGPRARGRSRSRRLAIRGGPGRSSATRGHVKPVWAPRGRAKRPPTKSTEGPPPRPVGRRRALVGRFPNHHFGRATRGLSRRRPTSDNQNAHLAHGDDLVSLTSCTMLRWRKSWTPLASKR